MKFTLISKKKTNKNPKCPDCWAGRLKYFKTLKVWICCRQGEGWMWCGRSYKGSKN